MKPKTFARLCGDLGVPLYKGMEIAKYIRKKWDTQETIITDNFNYLRDWGKRCKMTSEERTEFNLYIDGIKKVLSIKEERNEKKN